MKKVDKSGREVDSEGEYKVTIVDKKGKEETLTYVGIKPEVQKDSKIDPWREYGAYLSLLLTNQRIEDNIRYTEAQGEGLF